MCLNNVSDNPVYRFFQFLCARLLTAKTLAKRGYQTTDSFKKAAMRLADVVVGDLAVNLLVSVVRSRNEAETTYVGHFFGRARYRNSYFPKALLGCPRRVKFSDLLLPVPEHVEEYLELRYGPDYMEIPDKKTRDRYPSHAVLVDPDRVYSEYE